MVGYRSVTVVADPAATDMAAMGEELARIRGVAPDPATTRHLEIPVAFDGPDLDDVAGADRPVPRQAVVDQLVGSEFEVAFVGFLPGFAYLEGLPASAGGRPPPQSSPRSAVAAGSVGIGGGFAGIYPQASPGGWQLLGRHRLRALRPGDSRRSRPCAPVTGSGCGSCPIPGWWQPRARAPLRSATARTAVVDGTRPAVDGAGPRSRGRRPVGGAPGRCAPTPSPCGPPTAWWGTRTARRRSRSPRLGPRLRFGQAAHVAVVGRAEVSIDGRPVEVDTVVPVAPGQELSVGRTLDDLRCYVAVAGGFDVPPVLGSRSSDVLTGLGPGALQTGDVLGIGPPTRPRGRMVRAGRGQGPHVLRVRHGARRLRGRVPPTASPPPRGRWRRPATAWGCAWSGTSPWPRRGRASRRGGWSPARCRSRPTAGPWPCCATTPPWAATRCVGTVVRADLGVLGQCRSG